MKCVYPERHWLCTNVHWLILSTLLNNVCQNWYTNFSLTKRSPHYALPGRNRITFYLCLQIADKCILVTGNFSRFTTHHLNSLKWLPQYKDNQRIGFYNIPSHNCGLYNSALETLNHTFNKKIKTMEFLYLPHWTWSCPSSYDLYHSFWACRSHISAPGSLALLPVEHKIKINLLWLSRRHY